ncbi:hypothetical protein ACGF4C_32140 [Streptomyces sp. NPDC048197]|uniref:hypothetical protein n=1 Tax=Streptomyces sp. NPDC048197 TaxID=3365511 RepID=UPI003722280D
MSVDNTLVVPVEVAALAVNRQTRDTGSHHVIQRWNTNFKGIGQGEEPEPRPFDGLETWTGREDRLGVYLQWELPAALTRGRHDDEEGVGGFPLVPNRWLVVRHAHSTGTLKAWIVESDYLDEKNGTVSFQDPHGDEPKATLIGKCHELSGPWRHPDNPRTPFLTAIGPGLLTFSVFQPYNTNVFSLHDTLDDLAAEQEQLSYFVAGWYSDPASDILAGPEGLPEHLAPLLRRLEWTQPAGSGSQIRSSVYTGTVLGLDWNLAGPVPGPPCPRREDITVMVANTMSEAAAELGTQADGEGGFSAAEADLFRAFLLGGIEGLEERDRPEADILTDRRAHDTAFGPVPGGYRWFIGERGDDPGHIPAPDVVAARRSARVAEADTVAELNRMQAEHDATEAEFDAARERLYHLWWLSRREDQSEEFRERVPGTDEGELDLADPDGAAGQVIALAQRLAEQRRALPWGKTEADLAASIDALYSPYGSRADRRLIRVPAQDYEYSADPVLALQGAQLHAPLTRDTPLPCRTPDRLVTRASGLTTSDVADLVAQVNLSHLPPCFHALLTEFLILDRALATTGQIRDVTGTLPEYGTDAWEMPWQPLYLMWKAEYFPLPFRDGATAHWEFIERSRYQWQGTGTPGTPLTISGRQILTPAAGHALDGALTAYARVRDQLPADSIQHLHAKVRSTDLLSQTLDGFGAAIAQRRPGSGLQPTGPIADLVGNGNHPPPDPGGLPSSDWDPWPESTFQELRAGQLAFHELSVVDRFGRAVNLIGQAGHFRPEMPRTMRPAHPVSGHDSERLVELSPRLLQPARLSFSFLSATDDDIDLIPGANPVCAWLLHNRLDRSLVVHAPDGTSLGELRVTLTTDDRRAVSWSALPGSPLADFDQLEDFSPHTYRLLSAIKSGGPQTFDAFRATVDQALHTIDPDGPADPGLGFLLGRPLALVRTRLTLQLHGPLRTDVSWQNLFDPPEPELPRYPWTIRLGEARQTDDGLVGYVLAGDYDHFETVIDPVAGSGGYLRPIGDKPSLELDFGDHNTTVATVLCDPRAAVHATTDILATKRVFVPQEFTDQAIARMTVNFRTGPLLAGTTELLGSEGQVRETVLMPAPTGITGTWTWTEKRGTTWENLPILTQDPHDLPLAGPEVRSGHLTLGDAVAHTAES